MNFSIYLDEMLHAAINSCFIEVLAKFLYMINIQGRYLYLHDFIKYTFDTSLLQDTCELFCFKLGQHPFLYLYDSSFNDLDL